MTEISPDGVSEWNLSLDRLARRFSGLDPAAREAFVRRLTAQDEYPYADPALEAASAARRELLLAVASVLARSDIVTNSTTPRWKVQGEFDPPTASRVGLRLA